MGGILEDVEKRIDEERERAAKKKQEEAIKKAQQDAEHAEKTAKEIKDNN